MNNGEGDGTVAECLRDEGLSERITPKKRRRGRVTGGQPVPLECDEQTWLFQWAWGAAALKWPELMLMYAIPNGGSRHKTEAARLKAQGVNPGIPDICLPVARGGYHGLYIELKRRKGGRTSEKQDEKIPLLRAQGYRVEVCLGFQRAADVIEEYMTDSR